MKGLVQTGDLLRGFWIKKGTAVNDFLVMLPYFNALLPQGFCVTDVAMNIAPDLEAKVKILKMSVSVFHQLGIENPKVAVAAGRSKLILKWRLYTSEIKKDECEGELRLCC